MGAAASSGAFRRSSADEATSRFPTAAKLDVAADRKRLLQSRFTASNLDACVENNDLKVSESSSADWNGLLRPSFVSKRGGALQQPSKRLSLKEERARVRQRGVQVGWLAGLLETYAAEFCGGDQSFTTSELVSNWVMPKTKAGLCSFTDLGLVKISEPDAFVSHTWSRPFREMVTCLRHHFDASAFVWVDVFAINQHTAEEEGSDLEQLVDTVQEVPLTVVVVDPEGVVFSRAWCLYEMHVAATADSATRRRSLSGREMLLLEGGGGSDFGIMAAPSARKRRHSYYVEHYARALVGKLVLMPYLLLGADKDRLCGMMYGMDVRKASATHEADANNIRAAIDATTGATHFNGALKVAFAQGLSGLPDVITPGLSGTAYSWLEVAELAELAGHVVERAGMYAKCLKLHERCLGIRMSELGQRHPAVATALNNVGVAMHMSGRYAESGRALSEAIAMRRELLGEHHPQLASSINNLALVRMAEGEREEAEGLLHQALAIREAALGSCHEKSAATLNNLGRLMVERGEYDDAEALYRRTKNIFTTNLGAGHPFTTSSLFYLAEVSMLRGDLGSAEAMFREAHEQWETALGPNHPYSAACLSKLAVVLLVQEKYKDAEKLLSRALRLLRKLLGPEHPELPPVLVKLAEVEVQLGEDDRAGSLLAWSSTICKTNFAPNHAAQLETRRLLAVLALRRGEVEAARAVFEELLRLWSEGNQVCDFRCAAVLCDLAMLEHNHGDEATARMYAKRATFMSKAPSARHHPDVLRSLRAVALVLSRGASMMTEVIQKPIIAGGVSISSDSKPCDGAFDNKLGGGISVSAWTQRLPGRRALHALLPCIHQQSSVATSPLIIPNRIRNSNT